MNASVESVRKLREETGAGIMECRKALEETGGSLEKATALLRERGAAIAAAKEGRKAEEGLVMAYVHHGGKLGALVEVNCESDFVARNEEFVALTKELSMQVAATSPKWVSREDVPRDWLAAREEEFKKQAEVAGKSAQMGEFVKEKEEQLLSQVCLMEQPYIRDSAVTVSSLVTDKVAKFKEKIRVRRFVIFKLGGTEEQ
jgi:elongation factor Ts